MDTRSWCLEHHPLVISLAGYTVISIFSALWLAALSGSVSRSQRLSEMELILEWSCGAALNHWVGTQHWSSTHAPYAQNTEALQLPF